MSVPELVGSRIRMFRRLKNLSQEELAARIYKSKSIISKYELGQAALDIDTLFAIASVLEIDASDLLNIQVPRQRPNSGGRFGIFQCGTLYLMVRTKPGGLWKGVLTLRDREDQTVEATLYIQVPDYRDVTKCRAVYQGTLFNFPTNSAMLLFNVNDPSDMTGIFPFVYKGNANSCYGLFLQFSYVTSAPAVTKTVLSTTPLQECDALEEVLQVNKEDIAAIKRSNLFGHYRYIPESRFISPKEL